jgi:hypothetical protein
VQIRISRIVNESEVVSQSAKDELPALSLIARFKTPHKNSHFDVLVRYTLSGVKGTGLRPSTSVIPSSSAT